VRADEKMSKTIDEDRPNLIKIARQCLNFKGFECDNIECLNIYCPLNKQSCSDNGVTTPRITNKSEQDNNIKGDVYG